MAEDIVTRAEFNGVKDIIIEIKTDIKEKTKEQTIEMMGMRDSKIRTEIKLESIIKSQIASDANIAIVMQGITDLKNKPFIAWDTMATAWKIGIGIAVIGFVVPYFLGNYMTFIKMFK